MFDWVHATALHLMQGIQASSPAEGDVSWDFSRCNMNRGHIHELQRGRPIETPFCSVKLGLLSS